MTHIITVVTPAYKPVREYLTAAYESLLAQAMPDDWQWQWVVQEDGQTGDVASILPDDKRISAGTGRKTGEAVTPTMCLSRATGELIKVLDADDQLTPGALARDIAILSEYPSIGWTTSKVLDLLPDGSTVGFDDPPEGPIERGEVLRHWRAHNYRPQVHPVTLCIRRPWSGAGWVDGPASVRRYWLASGCQRYQFRLFYIRVGTLYRKWPGQMTSQADHADSIERPARVAIIEERATALATLWDSTRSHFHPGRDGLVTV